MLQSGPLASSPVILSLDRGHNPNPSGGGGGQVLGEPLPSLVLLDTLGWKVCFCNTLKLKGKNKVAELQLWSQPSDLMVRYLEGACLSPHRGKLRR